MLLNDVLVIERIANNYSKLFMSLRLLLNSVKVHNGQVIVNFFACNFFSDSPKPQTNKLLKGWCC